MTTKRDQFFRDVVDAAEREGVDGFALINTDPHRPLDALAEGQMVAMITELNHHLAPRYRVVPAEPQFTPCHGCGAQPVVLEGGVINHVCETSTFRSDADRWDDFQEECKAANGSREGHPERRPTATEAENEPEFIKDDDPRRIFQCPCGAHSPEALGLDVGSVCTCGSCGAVITRNFSNTWTVSGARRPVTPEAAQGIPGPGGDLLAEIPCSNCGCVVRVPIHPEPGDCCYCRGCSTEVKFSGGTLWIARPFVDPE